MWLLALAISWKAARWRVGGLPASLPAMSKPTTPESRWRRASSAISLGVGGVAHGGGQRADGDRPAGAAEPEALEHRLDDLVERQAAVDVQLGGEADLGVDDAVVRQVLGALGRHPHERVLGLHDPDRVLERLEVEVEVVAVGALREPLGQLVDVGGGEGVAGVSCELDDRRRAEAAVEVVVQQHLGSPPDLVEGGCSHAPGYRPPGIQRMVAGDGGAGDARAPAPSGVDAPTDGRGSGRRAGGRGRDGGARGGTGRRAGPRSVAGWSTTEGTDGRVYIADDQGRALQFHGFNVKTGDPATDASDQLLADAAARGMDHMRLVVFWDHLEPAQGEFDEAYLDEVVAAMDRAERHGILVILDMHQDVFGEAFGSRGVPAWATRTDGLAYVPQDVWFLNYLQPAVQAAFEHLYEDPDLRQAQIDAWLHVVERVQDHPRCSGTT